MNTFVNNPIAWASFQIHGGWRSHLSWVIGYLLLLVSVISATTKLNPGAPVLPGWTTMLLALQLAILILYGSTVVGNAVRRDITTGLLESHRLMPISPGTAVCGYLIGPTLRPMGLGLVNLIVGWVTTTLSGLSVEQWFVSNVVVVLFVVFLWVCVAFGSFIAKNAFGLMFGLIMAAVFSGGGLLTYVPALAILVTPIMGTSIFATMMMRGGLNVTPGYGWAFAAQFIFGAIFFRGAMRRYRRDDVPALGITLGLLLLGAWVAVSALAIVRWEDFNPRWARPIFDSDVRNMQTVGALLSSLLIGLTAIASSARVTVDWTRTRLVTGRAPPARPAPPPLIAIAAMGLVMTLAAISPPRYTVPRHGLPHAGVAMLSFYLGISYLLRIFYRAGSKAGLLTAAWIMVTWLLPLGADAVAHATIWERDTKPFFSLISPMGTLIDLWSDEPTGAVWGLIIQGLLAAAPLVLFYATGSRRRRQRPAAAAIAPLQSPLPPVAASAVEPHAGAGS